MGDFFSSSSPHIIWNFYFEGKHPSEYLGSVISSKYWTFEVPLHLLLIHFSLKKKKNEEKSSFTVAEQIVGENTFDPSYLFEFCRRLIRLGPPSRNESDGMDWAIKLLVNGFFSSSMDF